MVRWSIRQSVIPLALAVFGWPAIALANHHHIGGGSSGGGDDGDADCLLWGYVVADGGAANRSDGADATPADAGAAMSDAGAVADAAGGAATSDAGSGVPAGAVLVCLEHATMFGCDCATGAMAAKGRSFGAVVLVAATILVARRRRRRASRGGTP